MEMEEYENELQREETTEMGFKMEAETEMAGCGIVGGGRWEMEDRYVYGVANTFSFFFPFSLLFSDIGFFCCSAFVLSFLVLRWIFSL